MSETIPNTSQASQDDRTIAMLTHLSGIILGSVILIGALLNFLLWIVCIIFSIIAALAANKGEAYRYPFAIRLVK